MNGGAGAEGFLRIENVVKQFGEMRAVDGVSLSIRKGEIFALLGSSGCGKSTLLRMLAGLETPSSGRILLDGADLLQIPPYERPINMMFQSYALFPHLSVWQNVAFGLKRHGRPKAEVEAQVDKMLTLVQLKPYAKRKPHQLSGGQQQRVALARSLALEPQLLLLDEPLAALDRKLRQQTQFELKNIVRKVGVTCLMVTHDQEEAMTMADRIAVMSAGKFLQVGKPQDLYETPNCRFVADFVGNINLFDGVLAQDEADHCVIDTPQGKFFVNHGISGVRGMKLSVAVRPEKVDLTDTAPADTTYNCLKGTIEAGAYFGNMSVYQVVLASGLKLQVMVANTERHADLFHRGDAVYATFAPSALVVLTQ